MQNSLTNIIISSQNNCFLKFEAKFGLDRVFRRKPNRIPNRLVMAEPRKLNHLSHLQTFTILSQQEADIFQ